MEKIVSIFVSLDTFGYGVARKGEFKYALSPNKHKPSASRPFIRLPYKSELSKARQSEVEAG
jgi:hypothetical protein